jgi:hypothetical protein
MQAQHFIKLLSREMTTILIRKYSQDCADKGIKTVIGIGPGLLSDLTGDIANDFQSFGTIKSIDGSGREAKGTQEELLLWLHRTTRARFGRHNGMRVRRLKGTWLSPVKPSPLSMVIPSICRVLSTLRHVA